MSATKKKSSDQDKALERDESDEECCTIFLLKNLLFLFNFLILLSGIAILCVGLWTVIVKHSYVALLTSSVYQATSYLLILIGAFVIIIVFGVGCIGAWRENTLFLTIYAILLIIIFLLEAICGILAYVYEAKIHEELVENLNQTIITNYRHDPSVTQSIDDMQLAFKCCGAGSYLDWNHTTSKVPPSCCKTPSHICAEKSHHPSNINYKGCVDSLTDFLKSHLLILGAVGLGLCFLQIFGVIVSCWLIKKIKDRDNIKSYWH